MKFFIGRESYRVTPQNIELARTGLFLETGNPNRSVNNPTIQNKTAPSSLIRALTNGERLYQISNIILPYIPFIATVTDIITW
jgi:hypothetical protein